MKDHEKGWLEYVAETKADNPEWDEYISKPGVYMLMMGISHCNGGFHDMQGVYGTIGEAMQAFEGIFRKAEGVGDLNLSHLDPWAHILDIERLRIVSAFKRFPFGDRGGLDGIMARSWSPAFDCKDPSHKVWLSNSNVSLINESLDEIRPKLMALLATSSLARSSPNCEPSATDNKGARL